MKKQILLLLLLCSVIFTQAQVNSSKQLPTREEQLNEQYCNSLFKTAHGTILDLTDETAAQGYTNILLWLQGRVAGLSIYTSRTGIAVPYIRNQLATVFIDEMPVQYSWAGMLNPSDVAMIKIIKEPFAANTLYGSGGAVAIYTFRGDEEE